MNTCHNGFEKICHIDYGEKMRTFDVKVCRNIPKLNCTMPAEASNASSAEPCDCFANEIGRTSIVDNGQARNKHSFLHVVCESYFHTVVEDVPLCKQVMIEHCYDGIGGHQCTQVPRTECQLAKQNVTKFSSPTSNVRYIAPSHLCNALRVFQCNALQSTQ